jgi:hypothetical protein
MRALELHPRDHPPSLSKKVQSLDAADHCVYAKAGQAFIKSPEGIPGKADRISAKIHGM